MSTWEPSLLTGNAEIDDYHKRICEQVDLLMEVESLEATLEAVTWLFELIPEHFKQEEALMVNSVKGEYPAILKHQREHRDGFEDFTMMRARLLKAITSKAPPLVISAHVGNFTSALTHWLHQHVFDEDKRFARWLRGEDVVI